MAISKKTLRRAVLTFAGVIVFLLGFAWLALPGILQSQAQRIVLEKSGHRLSLATPEINPLALSLRLRDLKLDDPEGAPLLAFRELFVDLSAASLSFRGPVIDQLKLDGLSLNLVVGPDPARPLNWSRLLTAFAGGDAKPDAAPSPPPRIDIRHLVLSAARADVADRRLSPAFETRIDTFDLELHELSTLPDDSGRFRLSARTAIGALLEWNGTATLNPLSSSGHLSLQDVNLGKLAPLLAPHLPPELGFAPPEGKLGVALDYRLGHADGKPTLTLDAISLELAGLGLKKPKAPGAPEIRLAKLALVKGRFDLTQQWLAFDALALNDIRLESGGPRQRGHLVVLPELTLGASTIDLAKRDARLGVARLGGGTLKLRRDAQGKLDLVEVLAALARTTTDAGSKKPAPEPGEGAAPWQFSLERFSLSGLGVGLRDDGSDPALTLELADIALETAGVSEKLDRPLPLKASLRVASGGRLAVDGRVVPATPSLDLKVSLENLALSPAQPIVGKHAALDLAGGKLSAAGTLHHDPRASAYKGSFSVDALRLNEAGSERVFLGWKSLATRQLEVTRDKLQIGELLLDGVDTQLLIAKDKTTNFKRILRQQGASPPTAPAAAGSAPGAPQAGAAPAATPPGGSGFRIGIDRLRFKDGELEFADESLIFPFGTRIHHLRGSVAGLSSQPGAAGQLELDGQVDEYGLARAVGQIDLFDPTGFTEIKVQFRNLDMTRLTPYSATFAGRRIDSGKLSLDLDYNIRKRTLESQNQVVIDKLVLGERVQSPEAKDLPLDLALALLEDSDGRIDLGLPISGSLDDPQFSYGAIVWKVITNVLSKIVTAPFRALGALFGGGEEKLDSIAFEPGADRLTPPEREKVAKLAAALNKRPALALDIAGTWNAADRVALQDRQLRRALLEQSGQKLDPQGDPGPVALTSPAIQKALEALFEQRLGAAELAGLKNGYRSANPGKLEEGVAGKMMSRLSGLVKPPRKLSDSEIGALKGADYHSVLYQRLRDTEKVGDEPLKQLAKARSEWVRDLLVKGKAASDRIRLGAVEKLAGNDESIPLKLGLGTAKR